MSNQEEQSNTTEPSSLIIEKPKYDKDELLTILDELMFSGEYSEDVTINGRLKVAFKTRSAASTSEITRSMDSQKFNLLSTMMEQKALLCISHSLIAYNGIDLSTKSHAERKQFVEKLPSVMVSAISNALVKFDLKTEAALEETEAF